jgi:hypothetical protein
VHAAKAPDYFEEMPTGEMKRTSKFRDPASRIACNVVPCMDGLAVKARYPTGQSRAEEGRAGQRLLEPERSNYRGLCLMSESCRTKQAMSNRIRGDPVPISATERAWQSPSDGLNCREPSSDPQTTTVRISYVHASVASRTLQSPLAVEATRRPAAADKRRAPRRRRATRRRCSALSAAACLYICDTWRAVTLGNGIALLIAVLSMAGRGETHARAKWSSSDGRHPARHSWHCLIARLAYLSGGVSVSRARAVQEHGRARVGQGRAGQSKGSGMLTHPLRTWAPWQRKKKAPEAVSRQTSCLPALILAAISPSPPMDICSGIASRSQDADSALPMPAARCPLPIARTGI